ncbi:uncharacterized protein LOC121757994 [Salvia splendens]|uniref:uncharacterized protein LOC121757994 n=1 Tax=Salvia splendens TaxID=180675 RepID=UPI001C27AD60|nr:uncharacterized protein LOC121757994 [Salvia splendens]XP_042009373.1 uncharacterized protein LOC121757994 [Salvia splendens]
MAGENGRRLDNQNEKPTSPFPVVNSERISICEGKQQENGRSPANISDSSSSSLDNSSITDSPGSFNQRSDVARDPFVLTESPAIQVMERPKTSDPDSPSQWSVDSGDSLFSIHMESGSFSKEHSLSTSGDIGELSLSDAYLPRRVSPKSEESVDSSYTSSAAAAAKALEEARRAVKEDTKYAAEKPKDPPEASSSVPTDQNLSRSNTPQSHDDSDNESCVSTSTSESRCPMCQCLWCARMCTCCRWPNCSCGSWFRWPSCSSSCISWPNCCSSSCISCPSCCTNLHRWCSTSCCCYGWKRSSRFMDRNTGSSSKHKV